MLKNLPGADTFRPNRKTKPNKNMFYVTVCSCEIGDQFNSATTLVNTIKTLVKTIKTLVKRINVFKSEKPSNICRSDLLHNFSWCNLATLKNEVSGSSTSLILSGSPSIKSFQCFTKLRRTTTITCPCNLKLIIYGNQAPNWLTAAESLSISFKWLSNIGLRLLAHVSDPKARTFKLEPSNIPAPKFSQRMSGRST